jgi:phytoene dehydrogenase-like protein
VGLRARTARLPRGRNRGDHCADREVRPGFRDRIVGRVVRSTTGFAEYNGNYVDGGILTGAKDPLQLLFGPRRGLNPYRLGLPGTFICSAATPPGPDAHGMGGANAAASALRR